MGAIQLFLNITQQGLNNEWNTKISEALKALPSAEQVLVIEQNETSFAQINISYRLDQLSFNEIEKVVTDSGAYITDINIHFPSDMTGVSDPYGASAVSLSTEDNLKKIDGVLGGAISSQGEIKVQLDTTSKNKQAAIDEILKVFSTIRFGNS